MAVDLKIKASGGQQRVLGVPAVGQRIALDLFS